MFKTTSWVLGKWSRILHHKCHGDFVDPYKKILDVCHSRWIVKKWAKVFFNGTVDFFWKVISLELLGPMEMILCLPKKIQQHLRDTYKLFHGFFERILQGNIPKYLFTGGIALFQKFVFSTTSLVLKNRFHNKHHKGKKPCWAYKSYSIAAIVGTWRKHDQKSFLSQGR